MTTVPPFRGRQLEADLVRTKKAWSVVEIMREAQMRAGWPSILGLGILPSPQEPPPSPPPPDLVAGPIVAWRLWKIRQDGILLSVSQRAEWPTGAPMVGDPEEGSAGLYAMKTREGLVGHEYGRDCLVGQVALWGRVIEHRYGYRAEYAYPVMVDLQVPSPMPGFPRAARRTALAQAIRDNYGCEVRE